MNTRRVSQEAVTECIHENAPYIPSKLDSRVQARGVGAVGQMDGDFWQIPPPPRQLVVGRAEFFETRIEASFRAHVT